MPIIHFLVISPHSSRVGKLRKCTFCFTDTSHETQPLAHLFLLKAFSLSNGTAQEVLLLLGLFSSLVKKHVLLEREEISSQLKKYFITKNKVCTKGYTYS
ncbi:hypothetical protein CDAR_523611 [Caerostris darwini]|uniref:LAGLIDADG homing endonuclease n=1 Tax=Caerostris darwini TaxID=1538125 RepID=A0AAV4UNH4_9ARAC|nr:hypothetical protein CDAR_523611 [Caerostris darwini]